MSVPIQLEYNYSSNTHVCYGCRADPVMREKNGNAGEQQQSRDRSSVTVQYMFVRKPLHFLLEVVISGLFWLHLKHGL